MVLLSSCCSATVGALTWHALFQLGPGHLHASAHWDTEREKSQRSSFLFIKFIYHLINPAYSIGKNLVP